MKKVIAFIFCFAALSSLLVCAGNRPIVIKGVPDGLTCTMEQYSTDKINNAFLVNQMGSFLQKTRNSFENAMWGIIAAVLGLIALDQSSSRGSCRSSCYQSSWCPWGYYGDSYYYTDTQGESQAFKDLYRDIIIAKVCIKNETKEPIRFKKNNYLAKRTAAGDVMRVPLKDKDVLLNRYPGLSSQKCALYTLLVSMVIASGCFGYLTLSGFAQLLNCLSCQGVGWSIFGNSLLGIVTASCGWFGRSAWRMLGELRNLKQQFVTLKENLTTGWQGDLVTVQSGQTFEDFIFIDKIALIDAQLLNTDLLNSPYVLIVS